MSSVGFSPDPLPHGDTGTVQYETQAGAPWCEVGLVLDNGDYTSVQVLALFRGETTFSFGATATWDGESGGSIHLRLFEFRNGRQHKLAQATGTYL